jgi:hypothetical protein
MPIFGGKMGVKRVIMRAVGIENRRFWAKKQGSDLEMFTNV